VRVGQRGCVGAGAGGRMGGQVVRRCVLAACSHRRGTVVGQGCLAPFFEMTNQEQAELYVDKVGKNLNPSGDPQSGLHTFDEPAAGLPPGY
jgi:hypothetical protein